MQICEKLEIIKVFLHPSVKTTNKHQLYHVRISKCPDNKLLESDNNEYYLGGEMGVKGSINLFLVIVFDRIVCGKISKSPETIF